MGAVGEVVEDFAGRAVDGHGVLAWGISVLAFLLRFLGGELFRACG
jgi:hypothetical protein